MNRLLLCICLSMSAIVNISFAQDTDYTGFYIGPSISYVSGSISLSDNNRAVRGASLPNFNSISGGLLFNYQFEKLFLQTELVYNKREAIDPEFEFLDTSPFNTILTASFSYINMPLLVGYNFSDKSFCPYVIVGIQMGFVTSNELSLVFDEATPSFIPRNQPITTWDRTEFGAVIEGGFKKYLSTKSYISCAVRYTGAERSYLINNTTQTGGSANLGNKMGGASLSYLISF